jgi:RNA polymerase sigma-70 factor (ECF subfamily)
MLSRAGHEPPTSSASWTGITGLARPAAGIRRYDRAGGGGRARVVERFLAAWERAHVDAVVSMLAHDAVLAMPPEPTWFAGRDAIAAFLSATQCDATGWRITVLSFSGAVRLGSLR